MLRLKQVAYGVGTVALNFTLFGHALKANERVNTHLSSLSTEDRLKLSARHEYLKGRSTTYEGSGGLGDALANASYSQLPDEVKTRLENKIYFRNQR